jgi:hypothetical protein
MHISRSVSAVPILSIEEAYVGRHTTDVGRHRWRPLIATSAVLSAGGLLLVPWRSSGTDTAPPATTAPVVISATTVPSTPAPTAPPSTTVPPTTVPATTVSPTTVPPSTVPPSTTTPTTTLPSTTTAAPSGLLLLDVLAFVAVANEHRGGYQRDLFEHWIGQGGGCTTRDIVLGRDSSSPVQRDLFGCDVVAGDWFSVYDGAVLTDPADVDIDHVVALKEAWDSGAWAWSAEQRRAFANDLTDPRTLRAVADDANSDKGERDPSNWLPPRQEYWCTYLGDWVAIKVRWGLTMDQSEYGRIRNLVRDRCLDWRIEPTQPLPAFPEPVAIQPIAPPLAPPAGDATAPSTGAVYFENCDAARAAGAAPVLRGQPGYRSGLDRDDDGVACE